MLTQERLKELLHYCPDRGVFTWRMQLGRAKPGDVAGYDKSDGRFAIHRNIRIDKKNHKAHRLAFLYMNGEFPEEEVDHIDGNPLNNTWNNLRAVSGSENKKNRRIQRNNKSGHCGVSLQNGKFISKIKVGSKHIYLGCFTSLDDAIKARKDAEAQYGFHENHGSARPL